MTSPPASAYAYRNKSPAQRRPSSTQSSVPAEIKTCQLRPIHLTRTLNIYHTITMFHIISHGNGVKHTSHLSQCSTSSHTKMTSNIPDTITMFYIISGRSDDERTPHLSQCPTTAARQVCRRPTLMSGEPARPTLNECILGKALK